MATIPTKVSKRIIDGVKRFKPIVAKARDKDVNESDTVAIILEDEYLFPNLQAAQSAIRQFIREVIPVNGGKIIKSIQVK